MKLYATTTSERASSGQGGNRFLTIDILVENRTTPKARVYVTPEYIRIVNEETRETAKFKI